MAFYHLILTQPIRGLNTKLERWTDTLEAKGFRLSRLKTEYLHCRFSWGEGDIASAVAIEGAVILGVQRFRYLGSIIQENGEIDEDISHRVKVGWQKWRNASGVLCDRRIPLRLKGRVYHMIVRLALLYGAEC